MDHNKTPSASMLDAPSQASSALLSRRRRGISSRTRPPNQATADQGSPEVISSLISSLSTISVPVQTHFDSGPRIDSSTDPKSPFYIPPAEPESILEEQRPASEHGIGLKYSAPLTPADPPNSPFLHPDDAAAPPVIRMARAPPPSSPRSAKFPRSPKLKSPAFGAPPQSPARPASSASYASAATVCEDTTFGMITLEPGPVQSPAQPPPLSTAPSFASTGSTKSLKSPLGLLKKPSREFNNDKGKQPEQAQKANSFNDSPKQKVSCSGPSLRSMQSMADVAEEAQSGPSRKPANRPVSKSASNGSASKPGSRPGSKATTSGPSKKPVNKLAVKPTTQPASQPTMDPPKEPANNTPSKSRHSSQSSRESTSSTPGGIGGSRPIPARESSLRHSFSSSRKSTRQNRMSSTDSVRGTKVDSGVAGVGSEAEQVTKRIQELKDQQQKIKNEMEIDDSPEKTIRAGTASVKSAPASRKPSVIGEDSSSSIPATMSNVFAKLDESLPAPPNVTGKSTSMSRSGSLPLVSRPPSGLPPAFSARHSFDRFDHSEKPRNMRPADPVSPPRLHKRTPSGPISAGRSSFGEDRPSSVDSVDLAVSDYVNSSKLTQRVQHPTNGRVIAFSEVGDPKGHVVLCCLGMGLTRFLMAFYDELAQSLHLRLITLDRPGVGESGPYVDESGNPLSWPDDVAIVCNHLKVNKFSILAHSAGSIYALATALRIPQHIRGRIHLLAPWIPPSQFPTMGSPKAPVPTNALPYSQRILRALPTSFLKVANSSFMSSTSASLSSKSPKSPRRSKRKAAAKEASSPSAVESPGATRIHAKMQQQGADLQALQNVKSPSIINGMNEGTADHESQAAAMADERERQTEYDNRLTHRIWELATSNANPAVDLLVCLERHQPIGFQYVDITRNVVVHHGSRDTRVPVDNVRWLGQTMKRCEVRVLEGEGHGLMASAAVMGNVLMEIAKEWEDWMIIVQGRRKGTIGPRSGFAIPT